MNGNEKCDDDTNDDADGHDPYVSAMLRRRHKNSELDYKQMMVNYLTLFFPKLL